jgi:hypothetical protein
MAWQGYDEAPHRRSVGPKLDSLEAFEAREGVLQTSWARERSAIIMLAWRRMTPIVQTRQDIELCLFGPSRRLDISSAGSRRTFTKGTMFTFFSPPSQIFLIGIDLYLPCRK